MLEQDYFLGFSVFPGVGAKRFLLLLSRFKTAKNAWEASESELRDILKDKLTADFLEFRKKFDLLEYKSALNKKKISVVTFQDDAYPPCLNDLKNPPFVLYIKGDKRILEQFDKEVIEQNRRSIGIVGTRKVTSYGRQITEQFTKELVVEGCITVSGLALGVDAIAHQTTINSGGKTIAVLGCGVDCCYPSTNQELYDRILSSGGLIVSEYPIGAAPNKGSFPSRNRIIAALSQGLLVTEGAEDSGSLITAQIALDLGRTVFAIPGPLTSSLSRGPLKLIRKGAKLVTSGEEILQEFHISNGKFPVSNKKEIKGDTPEEQKIIDSLRHEELLFDEIVKRTGLTSIQIAIALSTLELKGIRKDQSGVYSLE